MNTNLTQTRLESYLSGLFPFVENWQSLQFNLVPDDPPKAFFQLVRVLPSRSTVVSEWVIGISFSESSLSDLTASVASAVDTLVANFAGSEICLESGGLLQLDSSIDIEGINTATVSAPLSSVSGYSTTVSFLVKVTEPA